MSIENTEYALIQLLIRNPQITVELKRKGMKSKFFKHENLGKAFNLINATYTGLGSTPTAEDLALYNVKIDKSDIVYTVEHLTQNIIKEYNKKIMGTIIESATDTLVADEGGAESASEVFFKNIKKLISLKDIQKYSEAPSVIDDIWEQYLVRAEWKASGRAGIPLGLHILDNHIKGLGAGWMCCLSARNGVGKTWVLANAILSAWKQGRTVAVFSCEMTKLEFLQRIICIDAGVNPTRFRDGDCTLEEVEKFKISALRCEQNYGIHYIGDNPGNFENIEEIVKEINEKNPNKPVEAIYIDSIYRLQIDGETETVKQKRIAMSTKTLAQKFNVPVVITTQMNREFGKMNTGKGKVQGGNYSLAGSDAFNTEADLILLLNKNEEAYSNFHYIDLVLEKFRHGDDGINYMIEMNLNIPQLKQVDYEFARSRIATDALPTSSRTGNTLIQQSKEIFNKNATPSNILENFKNHQDKRNKINNQILQEEETA